MKTFNPFICALMLSATPMLAQDSPMPSAPKPGGDYSSDIGTVRDAQGEALQQAKQALGEAQDPTVHNALQTAIAEMEKAESALDAAKSSPAKLGPALTAEQTAYQALLKATPHEYRISRQRNSQSGSQSGQPDRQQLNQLDLKDEANRYETERQASAQQTQQQREASEVANRLRELAQRQQDLNDRLRELQTALQAAKTDDERADIERQLKRLRDEERQMLADVDQLQQKMEQSPNADSNAQARQQLEQTRQDVQRAAQQMEQNSPSEALAAGTRAEQSMQNVRDEMRRQTSSQFTDQMRQLRNQARDLAQQEDNIAKKLDSMENGQQKLDNSADTQQLSDQLAKQADTLTNLMANMRAVSEQSENVEPLLSQKLYDTFRQADQRHTDNLLQMSSQLAQRGFLPQTSEVERSARTNINELRQGVESAAESVLGNETEALKYAQRELQDLTRQMEREMGGTNGMQAGAARAGAGQTNQLASARAQSAGRNGAGREGTNSTDMTAGGQNGNREMRDAQNNSQAGQQGERSQADSQGNAQGRNQDEQAQNGQNGQRGQQQGQRGQRNGSGAQQGNQQNGQQDEQAQNGQQGQQGQGNNQGNQAQNREGIQDQQGGQGGQGDQQADNNSTADQNASGEQNGQQNGGAQQNGGTQQGGDLAQQAQGGRNGGQNRDVERLTQIARQRTGGSDAYGGGAGGPITGGQYLNWADRLRDVEQALDSPDLRYQLATVRERASALRQQYREFRRRPDEQVVREQIIEPMTQVRVWLEQELARQQNADSLVPLDRDPVPDNYSELVRKYYEKLGSAQ